MIKLNYAFVLVTKYPLCKHVETLWTWLVYVYAMNKLNFTYAMFMLKVFMPCLCLTLCYAYARNIYDMLMFDIMPK